MDVEQVLRFFESREKNKQKTSALFCHPHLLTSGKKADAVAARKQRHGTQCSLAEAGVPRYARPGAFALRQHYGELPAAPQCSRWLLSSGLDGPKTSGE